MPDHAEGIASARPEDLYDHLVGRIKALRDALIDISARNPLISFKHSERAAGFIRVVDERPDCLFESLQSGEMQFEPLPDPREQPADEKSADVQIALEAARLTDPDYLDAMQKLGESETVARITSIRATSSRPGRTRQPRIWRTIRSAFCM